MSHSAPCSPLRRKKWIASTPLFGRRATWSWCNADGIALQHRGNETTAEQFKYWGTWTGGVWSEGVEGGTLLDSLRFRFHLARHLNVDAASVEANVLGEHGTSETFVWSSASMSGVPVLDALKLSGESRKTFCRQIEHDVRFANIEIIEGNQASQFGIGMVAARIAQAVLRDERIVVPIGSYNADYGVTFSMPSVLGRTGVEQILEPSMSADERTALLLSAARLRDALASLPQHTHA